MNPWNPRRKDVKWIESRASGVRHFVDWRENVLRGHTDPALVSRLGVSRVRPSWFRDDEHADLVARRERAGLPSTDLASEDSEDALTWSVFSVFATVAACPWWRAFELERKPEIELWPRHETGDSEVAQAYRMCGEVVEPHHRADQRSEIDVLLSTPSRDLLVEAKWKTAPLVSGKRRISTDTSLDRKIATHLSDLAASLLVSNVTLEDVLAAGAYQTLRHLLYARELARKTARPAGVAYLIRHEAVGAKSIARAELDEVARELFGPLFLEPLPRIVPWASALAELDDAVVDTPLPPGEVHTGATFRDYLIGRRVGGQPAPLARPRNITCGDADADPPLVLDGVWASRVVDGVWIDEQRAWPIQTPRAKLLAKYRIGTSALFGHYVYRYPHVEPDLITPLDVEAADRLMGANIGVQRERRANVLAAGASTEVVKALAEIPANATIENVAHDVPLCAAIAALTSWDGIGVAIATKLLCIKRPGLVPMMDSVVQACFRTADPATILREFRRLVLSPVVASRVDELRSAVAAVTGFAPTVVRILDELIWFDWNLERARHDVVRVVGFPDWGYETGNDQLGVHYLPGG